MSLRRSPEVQVHLRPVGRRAGSHRADPPGAQGRGGGAAPAAGEPPPTSRPPTTAAGRRDAAERRHAAEDTACRSRSPARRHARRLRFVVASHQRPDGDAVGSAMAMALALRALGKAADVVMDAPPPHFLQPFPGVGSHPRHARGRPRPYDAALIMECSTLDRTGVDRPRPIAGAEHRSPSRQHAATAPSTGSTNRRRRAARWCSR